MILFLSLAFSFTLAFTLDNSDEPIERVELLEEVEIVVPSEEVLIASSEVTCLAMNIYFEAGNQPIVGKVAVAHVTLNRVNSARFPNTICEVVKQAKTAVNSNGKEYILRNKCQFSWYCDGKPDNPHDSRTWEQSLELANEFINTTQLDITDGALWYHADYVDPYWASHLNHVTQIETHIFYK